MRVPDDWYRTRTPEERVFLFRLLLYGMIAGNILIIVGFIFFLLYLLGVI